MHEKVRRETRHPIQETGMYRKGERNVHPFRAKRDTRRNAVPLI